MTPQEECRGAFVGKGTAHFEIRLEEAEPIRVRSGLQIFNLGRKNGIPTLTADLVTRIPVPTPALLIATIRIKGIPRGRYGSEATITFPKIAGGSGSITSLDLRLKKQLPFNGKRFSPIASSAPTASSSSVTPRPSSTTKRPKPEWLRPKCSAPAPAADPSGDPSPAGQLRPRTATERRLRGDPAGQEQRRDQAAEEYSVTGAKADEGEDREDGKQVDYRRREAVAGAHGGVDDEEQDAERHRKGDRPHVEVVAVAHDQAAEEIEQA